MKEVQTHSHIHLIFIIVVVIIMIVCIYLSISIYLIDLLQDHIFTVLHLNTLSSINLHSYHTWSIVMQASSLSESLHLWVDDFNMYTHTVVHILGENE